MSRSIYRNAILASSPLWLSLACSADVPGAHVAHVAHVASARDSRPNIVFVLVDDLGSADVGFRGSKIQTPNIDRLAREGVRLDTFYAAPVCTPSRAALMTGRLPMRLGLQEEVLHPWTRYGLPLDERTLAQALRDAGYRTEMVGKWHLGSFEPAYQPEQRGFEHHYGSYTGVTDYLTHQRAGGLDWHRDGKDVVEEGHTTNLVADEAVKIISRPRDGHPLFLYVAFNAPHAPHKPPAECGELYADMQPPERIAYARQVTCLDRALGRILDALDTNHMAESTLVVFASDNGGNGKHGDNRPLRGKKGTPYEGGVRVVALVRWTGTLKPSRVSEPLAMIDWFPTLVKLGGGTLDGGKPVDGKDAWGTIARGEPSPHAELVIDLEPERAAIRKGRWKLVVNAVWPKPGSDATLVRSAELYDLDADPGEAKNLARDNESLVKELLAKLVALSREAIPPRGGLRDERPANFTLGDEED